MIDENSLLTDSLQRIAKIAVIQMQYNKIGINF